MIKNLFAGLGIQCSQWFFLFLFGSIPPVQDKEAFRQWCLKNHRWIVLITKRTVNVWDDAAADMLLTVLQTPSLFDPFWETVTKNQVQIESKSKKSVLSIVSILTIISNIASAIKIR